MHHPSNPITNALAAEYASEVAPTAELWPRIVAARERTLRGRRRRRVAAAALAVAIGIGGVAALRAPQMLLQRETPTLVAGQRESQALEAQWRAVALQTNPEPGALTPLRVVDAALQSAYERHAAAVEIETLWAERNRALSALIHSQSGDQGRFSVTRI